MGAVGVIIWQKAGNKRGWLVGVIVVVLIAFVTLPTMFFMNFSSIGGGARTSDMVIVQTQTVAGEEQVKILAATGIASQPQLERLIIRNGSTTLVVKDTRAAHQSIEQIVAEMTGEGAFVVSSTERGSGVEQSPYISLQIRIPATRFDETMDRLAALAVEVRDRNETAQDVTEEYVDVQSRLEALEAARRRLLEIMQNADTTEDLLLAEQQLTQRESELEALQGRLNYLSESARLSSIAIDLWPDLPSQPLDTRWRPNETARRAIDALVSSLQGFADFVIFSGIAVVPWLLVIGLVVLGGMRWWRARRKKMPTQEKAP